MQQVSIKINSYLYCFYYGFDQYISERTYKENMMLISVSQYTEKEYEDVLKTVRLQICKINIKQEPLFENTAHTESKNRYDVSVCIEITADHLDFPISKPDRQISNSIA